MQDMALCFFKQLEAPFTSARVRLDSACATLLCGESMRMNCWLPSKSQNLRFAGCLVSSHPTVLLHISWLHSAGVYHVLITLWWLLLG